MTELANLLVPAPLLKMAPFWDDFQLLGSLLLPGWDVGQLVLLLLLVVLAQGGSLHLDSHTWVEIVAPVSLHKLTAWPSRAGRGVLLMLLLRWQKCRVFEGARLSGTPSLLVEFAKTFFSDKLLVNRILVKF